MYNAPPGTLLQLKDQMYQEIEDISIDYTISWM